MNRKPILALIIALGFSLLACDDDPSVSLVGKSIPQQTDDIADAVCERQADCGEVEISCNIDGCTGVIEPVSYSECVAEETPEIQGDLENCALTDAELEAVEDCLNALLAQDCITQAELDAAIENDEEIGNTPPECIAAFSVFEDCE